MMKFSKTFCGLLPALLVFGGCSNDKDNEKNPDGPQGGGTMETLSPEESKQYLQQTATEFLDLFKPADQKEVIELASYFEANYGGFDLPENFDIEEDTKAYMRALREVASGNLDALVKAAYTYNYTISFSRFTGVYEPNKSREEWVKTGNSDKIIFKFSNSTGGESVLTITQSGGTSDVNFSYLEKWYSYDWSNWDPNTGDPEKEEVRETYNYYLSIPKTVNVTLVNGGKKLASSTVTSSIDTKNHTITANVTASSCNIAVNATVAGDDSRVEARTEYSMNGKVVANAYATLTGKQLCDISKWEEIVSNENDYTDSEIETSDILADMLEKLDCGADVLGKVQVYGQGTYYVRMADDLDFYESSYNNSKDEAEKKAREACNRLNKNIKTQLRYDGTATDQASLVFKPYLDVYYQNQWNYTIETNLLFPDQSTYSIDSYFDSFTNVSNKWDVLIDAYEKVWDNAKLK